MYLKASRYPALLSASLLLGGLASSAQNYAQSPNRPGGSYDPQDGRPNRNAANARRSVIEGVQRDLTRLSANFTADIYERGLFNHAQESLQQFQSRWAQNNFDQGSLDEAIAALQDLAQSNQVTSRDRTVLTNHLATLRNFRASRGESNNSGVFGSNGRNPNTRQMPNDASEIVRIQNDLRRLTANSISGSHEREHLNHAQEALQQFQQRSSQGNVDLSRLDEAINSLQDLVQSNQINTRDRTVLTNHLAALRNFRANPGISDSHSRNPNTPQPTNAAALIVRVQDDLRRMADNSRVGSREREELNHALEALQLFQRRSAQGNVDPARLDEAMTTLQDLVQGNQLNSGDRSVLTTHLAALRDLRANPKGTANPGIFDSNSRNPNTTQAPNDAALIVQVQNDLRRVAANSTFGSQVRELSHHAQEALQQFQSRWSQGTFEQGRLDEAITSLQGLVQSNQVIARDRSVLTNHLAALRNLRANRSGTANPGIFDSNNRNPNTTEPPNDAAVIGRIQNNLRRVAANSGADSHEREVSNHALEVLQQFQSRWAQGNFDLGRLDEAIASLQDLGQSNQLNTRDRTVMTDHLAELRNLRARPRR